MNDLEPPRLSLWPFLLGDAMLLVTAGMIVQLSSRPLSTVAASLCVACVALAAWIGILPFLKRYQMDQKLAEVESLDSVVDQINSMELVAKRVSQVTGYLQTMQDQSEKTVAAAGELTEKMISEAKDFQNFLTQANDREKAHLKLETEKLRRAENDWLSVLTFVLDHVFALYQAGVRAGQPDLINQLTNFQSACREASRRVGLIAYEPKPGEPFNNEIHRVPNDHDTVAEGVVIDQVIACGFNFQGKMLRSALVKVRGLEEEPSPEAGKGDSRQMEMVPSEEGGA